MQKADAVLHDLHLQITDTTPPKISRPSDANVQLVDTTGRRAAAWNLEGLKAGGNALALPCAELASGVYFLRARAGKEEKRLRVVLAER